MGNGVTTAREILGRELARDTAACEPQLNTSARPEVRGKFLWVGGERLYVKGATYGAFEPNENGNEYHRYELIERDFALMAESGMNAVRIPHTMPPVTLLDAAQRHGLRVMVGLSAEQHVGSSTTGRVRPTSTARVRARGARRCAGHPALLCYAVGNEIPAPIVRWHGRASVERFLEQLYELRQGRGPGRRSSPTSTTRRPSTSSCRSSTSSASTSTSSSSERLEAYLARLQNLAGDRPLLMTEIGLDALRNGEEAQARDARLAGAHRVRGRAARAPSSSPGPTSGTAAGATSTTGTSGSRDRDRAPKPALAAVREAFADAPFPDDRDVAARLASSSAPTTARARSATASRGSRALDYPDFEVIVVDDGSTDATAAIAAEYDVRLISTGEPRPVAARATPGWQAATGEIVAYIDDDAYPIRTGSPTSPTRS